LPRPMAYSAERFAQSSSSASCCHRARRIALVTILSNSAAKRDKTDLPAPALARLQGGCRCNKNPPTQGGGVSGGVASDPSRQDNSFPIPRHRSWRTH